jgi:hypothetical protein
MTTEMAINPQVTADAADNFSDTGNAGLDILATIQNGVAAQGPYWGDDEYDEGYGEFYPALKEGEEVFPGLREGSGEISANLLSTVQGYVTSDHQGAEMAKPLGAINPGEVL